MTKYRYERCRRWHSINTYSANSSECGSQFRAKKHPEAWIRFFDRLYFAIRVITSTLKWTPMFAEYVWWWGTFAKIYVSTVITLICCDQNTSLGWDSSLHHPQPGRIALRQYAIGAKYLGERNIQKMSRPGLAWNQLSWGSWYKLFCSSHFP